MFKPDNITSPEQLFKEIQDIQAYLESSEIPEGNALVERAMTINIYTARTGKMLADAKYHLDTLTNSEIFKVLKESMEDKLSPSLLNKFIQSATKDYNYLVNWIERINRACTHESDTIRTLISREKVLFNRN